MSRGISFTPIAYFHFPHRSLSLEKKSMQRALFPLALNINHIRFDKYFVSCQSDLVSFSCQSLIPYPYQFNFTSSKSYQFCLSTAIFHCGYRLRQAKEFLVFPFNLFSYFDSDGWKIRRKKMFRVLLFRARSIEF